MIRSRSSRWAALLMAATMVTAACGGDDDDDEGSSATTAAGEDKQEVAIAFVGPLTGDNANLGINIRDGMRGGRSRRPTRRATKYKYVMKEFDTQGDPAQAPGQKDKYIPDEAIIGVVGPTFSGETKAVLPDLDEAGLVMVSASATNVDLPTVVPGTKVFHRVIPDDGVQAKGVTDYVTQGLKPKKVALIHDNTDYGKGLWEGVVKQLDADGRATPSTTDAIDPKAQDYSAAVNKVKAGRRRPDLLRRLLQRGRPAQEAAHRRRRGRQVHQRRRLARPRLRRQLRRRRRRGRPDHLPVPAGHARRSTARLGEFATKYKDVIGKDPGTYSSRGLRRRQHPDRGHRGRQRHAGQSCSSYVEGLEQLRRRVQDDRVRGQRQRQGRRRVRLRGEGRQARAELGKTSGTLARPA